MAIRRSVVRNFSDEAPAAAGAIVSRVRLACAGTASARTRERAAILTLAQISAA